MLFYSALTYNKKDINFLNRTSEETNECRKDQYPAALQRCKIDAPLLAAGILT